MTKDRLYIHKSLVKQFEGDTVYFKVINDNKR